MTIKKVLENVKAIGAVNSLKDLNDEVICAFEDYEYDGESEIVFDESSNSGYDYVAYANHKDSPQILMNVDTDKDNNGNITTVTVTNAWAA